MFPCSVSGASGALICNPCCVEARDPPVAIPSQPDLSNVSLYGHPLLAVTALDDIRHGPGHHGRVSPEAPNEQRAAQDFEEPEKASSVLQQLWLSVHDPRGVDVDKVVRQQRGKALHIVGHERVSPLALTLQQFALELFLRRLQGCRPLLRLIADSWFGRVRSSVVAVQSHGALAAIRRFDRLHWDPTAELLGWGELQCGLSDWTSTCSQPLTY